MSVPNRAARKSAAITKTANQARTSAGKAITQPGLLTVGNNGGRAAKPTLESRVSTPAKTRRTRK